jgi:murein DD-endopeptidase MepM/ murein hydrolase activator NlpD
MKKAKLNLKFGLGLKITAALLLLVCAAATYRLASGPRAAMDDAVIIETHINVASGDTLSKILGAHNVSGQDINTIAELLKKDCGVSGLRADSDYLIVSRNDENAPINKITLASGPWKRVELNCIDGKWDANIVNVERDVRLVRRVGRISDGDSFYSAGMRAGIPAGVIADVYDLLAFEMDFERDVRAGQEFSVLYEENYNGAKYVNSGAVIAVSFDALRGKVNMYRFRKSDGAIGYYDEAGNGAIKSLKRTPINNARVSSSFSSKRRHPVLGFTRAHKGVDFRAGHGTPIPAAGAGRVVERKYGGGYGNYVTIRHNGAYSTRYAHMSRFQKGVSVGTGVRQGQIIGYVGSTGLSTGPHLHYEIIQNGRHVNPMTVKLPAISSLGEADKQRFVKYREALDNTAEMLSENPGLFVQM